MVSHLDNFAYVSYTYPSMEKAEYYFADSVTAGKPVKASAEAVRRYRLKTALHEAGLL